MFHKKTLLTLAVLGLILTAGITSTYAFQGSNWGPKANLSEDERQEIDANHEAIKEALENNDYDTWVSLITERQKLREGEGRGLEPKVNILDAINSQEDFAKLVQAHEARQSGDFETAGQIEEELGLPTRPPHKMGRFMGNHEFVDTNGDGVCNQLDLDK